MDEVDDECYVDAWVRRAGQLEAQLKEAVALLWRVQTELDGDLLADIQRFISKVKDGRDGKD